MYGPSSPEGVLCLGLIGSSPSIAWREKTCHAEGAYVWMQVVQDYNANDDVHGILVQLPLPKHINEQRILDAISLEKDVDGFHPFNIGSLAMRGRQPLYTSCTPKVGRHLFTVHSRGFSPSILVRNSAARSHSSNFQESCGRHHWQQPGRPSFRQQVKCSQMRSIVCLSSSSRWSASWISALVR
jgi:hypothetical protein